MASVLVIGASGFIGRHVVRRLVETRSHAVAGTVLSQTPPDDGADWRRVDLTSPENIAGVFHSVEPEIVVHLAAMADVNTAERQPDRAAAVNADATASIARLCRQSGARLVFISTEYVFDGRHGPYGEADSPNPATQYGRTKFQAEQHVARLADRWSIVRTSIVYGWPHPGKRNYLPRLVERLRNGQTCPAPTDVYRTPVYVEHLVDGIHQLVEEEHPGVHHVAGSDRVSMYDFARAIADAFGLDRKLVLASTDPTPGPERLGLDCSLTMRSLGLPQCGLSQGLAACREASPTNRA